MKRSKFTEAQIAFILRQAEEGTVVGEVCRKAGISEATFYNWRKKYHGLAPSEMSGCTSSRRRTANSRRSWRSVALSGTRPTLTEAHWKKAGSLVQGWGAVHSRSITGVPRICPTKYLTPNCRLAQGRAGRNNN